MMRLINNDPIVQFKKSLNISSKRQSSIGRKDMGIRFLTNRAEILYGNSGNYYLSIAGMKSMLWRLVSD